MDKKTTTDQVKAPEPTTARCPFCRSSHIQVFSGADSMTPMGYAFLRCLGCGAIVSFMEHRTEQTLIRAWNRRAQPNCQGDMGQEICGGAT